MTKVKSRSPLGQLPAFKKDPIAFLKVMEEKQQPVLRFRFAHRPVYLLMHPALIEETLIRKADYFYKSKPFKELEPILGQGLLLSEGQFHKKQRSHIQPLFTPKHIQTYVEDMAHCTKGKIDDWTDNKARPISKDFMELTLQVIVKTMFGTMVENGDALVGKPLETAMEVAVQRIRTIWKSPKGLNIGNNRLFNKAVGDLNQMVDHIIEQHSEGNDSLLSLLKNPRAKGEGSMSIQQLRDEVMTIFLAGHETTAVTLTWTLYLLMNHLDVYEKVVEEVEDVLSGDLPTYQEATALTYTKKVILESMRLYPPAWLFGRQAQEDVNIGSTYVKKGSTLMISPYAMHRNRRYFDYTDDFIPDRFENGKPVGVPEFVYLPFGAGSRICIGQHFAIVEMLVILSTMIKSIQFSPLSSKLSVTPDPLITLRPKEGLWVLAKRKL
ncbi:cytochrome P450 [Halobacillus litoralis]|uniref:cytochrome P450 n=1 Tax=Halobacillus litoralis TaxID=45668 RepID=UPI001CFDF5F6|nr:cytochrome P450 [Halobacillus litoralis]